MSARFLTAAHYQELLAPETADRADVDLLVERAEMLVLGQFTEGLDRHVALDGYDEDPAACDEDLLRRLRLTVAVVVEHLATAPDPRIQAMRRGERSVTYTSVARVLPPGWDGLLAPFDARDVCYRI